MSAAQQLPITGDDLVNAVFYTMLVGFTIPTEIGWGTTCVCGPIEGRWHGWRWKRERRRQYTAHAALEAR